MTPHKGISSGVLAALLSLALLPGMLSCNKEDTYTTQESAIEKFISGMMERDSSYRVTINDGAVRLTVTEGQGDALSASGTVSFYYAIYPFTSSVSVTANSLAQTNDPGTATAANWNLTDSTAFDPLTVNLAEADLVKGLKSGLEGVKASEECYILFSGKYAWDKRSNGTIPAKSALAFHVWVEAIQND